MGKVKIILDPGSCHLGKLEYAKELVKIAADCGADSCKFQLFKGIDYTACGNIELSRELFPELVEYGNENSVEIFASVFDRDATDLLIEHNCKSIKFSYSKAIYSNSVSELDFDNIYVSCDLSTYNNARKSPKTKKLYCIPQYPVQYLIDFNEIFPRFDGFSDHTLGYHQTLNAVYEGAKVIEKHFRLDISECDTIPDGKFALYPRQVEKMVKLIRDYE